jgi:hypothetical protein
MTSTDERPGWCAGVEADLYSLLGFDPPHTYAWTVPADQQVTDVGYWLDGVVAADEHVLGFMEREDYLPIEVERTPLSEDSVLMRFYVVRIILEDD